MNDHERLEEVRPGEGLEEAAVRAAVGPDGAPPPVEVEMVDPEAVEREAHAPAAPDAGGEPPDEFLVSLDRFAGPLDLLLHLIREQDIDILDIPVGKVTEQFLAAIEGIDVTGLDNAGDFLEMAATLVRIKARMLLPRPAGATDLESDPRYELVRRLLEYEHFREAARRMEVAETERARHYARGYVPPAPAPSVPEELPIEWADVWEATLGLEGRERELRQHQVARRGVPVDHKMRVIVGALRRLKRVEFRELVAPFRDRLHSIVTLLAGLELARSQRVSLKQSTPFSPLWLFRGEKIDEEDPEGPGAEEGAKP
ncbi:MAG: segregation/condensation protein A [Gemmatimonadota bacterium]